MAQGIVTPLQLTAAAGLMANAGIKPLPAALNAALVAFNSTTLISNFIAAVNFYKAQSFATQSTLESLLSIGNTVCPALGNSIPASPVGSYPYLNAEYLTTPFNATDGSTLDPSGFSELIRQTASAYLGDGDNGRFSQGFMAVQGYINTTNTFINSAVNAETYLGPTFSSTDSLITNNISDMNPDLGAFGTDLANQGLLTNFGDLNQYGTPGALLRQLATVGRFQGGMPGFVSNPLQTAGINAAGIQSLLNGGVDITESQYNLLQRQAYQAMQNITGDALTQVLQILDVTTANIANMADLLDQSKIFPNSYTTLQTPTPTGYEPIYGPDLSVNLDLANNVANFLPQPTGCDDLQKVIPAALAVSSKAVQSSYQQLQGVNATSLPALAQAVKGFSPNTWNLDNTYLADALVSQGQPIPTLYRAQQDVPAGTDINDTNFWLPTTVGGLSTAAGLPLIQDQTQIIASSVSDYFANSVATGTGPNGTITTCDVLGLAIDHDDFASRLNTATSAVNTLQSAGSLNTLNTAYTAILVAANDAAVLTQIANANAAIAALSANPNVPTLNTAWTYMANLMNLSAKYTTEASIDYFVLPAGDKVSVMALVQNFSQYGTQNNSCGPAAFLNSVADTNTLTGQAIVACLREASNAQQLGRAGLGLDITPSTTPAVTPVPAVIPVY